MRFLLASTTLVVLLTARGAAWAGEAGEGAEGSSNVAVGRCVEAPLSAAVALAELEPEEARVSGALRGSGAGATSEGRAVRVQAMPSRLPLSPVPRVCLSPDDPTCKVSTPPVAPSRVQLEHAVRGFAAGPDFTKVPPATPVGTPNWTPSAGVVLEAHRPPPWRPPRG